MITVDLKDAKDVDDFYRRIVEGQLQAHGEGYTGHHDAIRKYLPPAGTYLELGTHQGATAACALLCNPSRVTLVDHNHEKYRAFLRPLAGLYCFEKNIKLDVRECSSISKESVIPSDVMLIDSRHVSNHMNQELNLHGNNISKYIIAHDTSMITRRPNESLYHCLKSWGDKNGWKVVERGTTNVGYTVIGRV